MRPSEVLERYRSEIAAVLARYRATNPRVFGSVAKGRDTDASDLDILIQPPTDMTYFDLIELERALGSLTGIKVDVRTEGEFSARVLSRISRDFHPI